MKEIEITNFDLTYDGMYFIKWDNHEMRVFLELNTILKMLQIEGLSFNDVDVCLKVWKPIHFNKVKLIVEALEENGKSIFITSDFSEEYFGLQNISMIAIKLEEPG